MTFEELLAEAAAQGYQLVPLPEVIDHDLRPGDVVEEVMPPGMAEVTRRVAGRAGLDADKMFSFQPIRGTVIAVASRADVMIRRLDGRVVFSTARGLRGEPTVRKVGTGQ